MAKITTTQEVLRIRKLRRGLNAAFIRASLPPLTKLVRKVKRDGFRSSGKPRARIVISRSGSMKDSVRSFIRSTGRSISLGIKMGGSGAPHAPFVEKGTRGHMVRPRRAKVLHWIQDGQARFSKGHFVSGIKGRRILRRIFNREQKNFFRSLRTAMTQEFRMAV